MLLNSRTAFVIEDDDCKAAGGRASVDGATSKRDPSNEPFLQNVSTDTIALSNERLMTIRLSEEVATPIKLRKHVCSLDVTRAGGKKELPQ